jgi:pyruvate kinase
MRLTKIVATLGPASMSVAGIQSLVEAGVSVFRLNCSHLSTEDLPGIISLVREAAPHSGIMVDVQGPKLRFSPASLELPSGAAVSFTLNDLGIDTSVNGDARGLEKGHRILMDDGRIETIVEHINGEEINVRVVRGGLLQQGKGVNLPDTEVRGSLLSKKDLADLLVARHLGVEIVAVSFVQTPSDVVSVREIVGDATLVFAKIERPQALTRIDEICAVSDGVMAARGDLGVEIPYESVPVAQTQIARSALRHGVISICATEMLESMTTSSRPTRAEVADVSGAVRDGFDAVMLSGETAVGKNPSETVRAMARICEESEKHVSMPNYFADQNPVAAAVTAAASALAKRTSASFILSISLTGFSARLMSSCRPACPIVAVTPNAEKARQLNVNRGIYPILLERDRNFTSAVTKAIQATKDNGILQGGDAIVVCASRSNPHSDSDTILLHREP